MDDKESRFPPPQPSPECEEMKKELEALSDFPHAARLLRDHIESLSQAVPTEPDWLEVDVHKNIRICKKVVIPSDKHPHFNFVGKLIGPGGKTLQELCSTYKSRVFVFGKGSTRDPAKEQELLESGDPKYAHFGERLHVKIETIGSPCMAYRRIADLLDQLQYFMQPINDDLVRTQLQEVGAPIRGRGGHPGGGGYAPQRGGAMPRGRGMVSRRPSRMARGTRTGRPMTRPQQPTYYEYHHDDTGVMYEEEYDNGTQEGMEDVYYERRGATTEDYYGNARSGAVPEYAEYEEYVSEDPGYYTRDPMGGGAEYTDFGSGYAGSSGGGKYPSPGRGRSRAMTGVTRRPLRRAAASAAMY